MGLALFSLRLTADRPPSVEVNSQPIDIGNLVGITIRHQPPSLPQMVLEVTGEFELTGEGIVSVDHGVGDEIAYLREFIANLSAEELDQATLAAFDIEDVLTPGDALKVAILKMISE